MDNIVMPIWAQRVLRVMQAYIRLFGMDALDRAAIWYDTVSDKGVNFRLYSPEENTSRHKLLDVIFVNEAIDTCTDEQAVAQKLWMLIGAYYAEETPENRDRYPHRIDGQPYPA